MAIKNQDHPFFRPLWRRVAIVLLTAVWCAVEWWHGETTWVFLTGGICAYALWTFFVTYPAAPSDAPAKDEPV